jgi:hypothetical protein
MNNSKAFDGYDSWLLSGLDDDLEMEISMAGNDEAFDVAEDMAYELLENDPQYVSELLGYDDTWQSTAIAVGAGEYESAELTRVIIGIIMDDLIHNHSDAIVDRILAHRASV